MLNNECSIWKSHWDNNAWDERSPRSPCALAHGELSHDYITKTQKEFALTGEAFLLHRDKPSGFRNAENTMERLETSAWIELTNSKDGQKVWINLDQALQINFTAVDKLRKSEEMAHVQNFASWLITTVPAEIRALRRYVESRRLSVE